MGRNNSRSGQVMREERETETGTEKGKKISEKMAECENLKMRGEKLEKQKISCHLLSEIYTFAGQQR